MLLTFPWAGNGSTVGTCLPSLSYKSSTQFGLLKQIANSTKAWVRFEYDDFLWRWWWHLFHTGFAAVHLGAWSFVLTAIRVVLQRTCPLSNKQTWHWTRNRSVNLVARIARRRELRLQSRGYTASPDMNWKAWKAAVWIDVLHQWLCTSCNCFVHIP